MAFYPSRTGLRTLALLLFTLCSIGRGFTQYTSADESDPEAGKIINRIQEKLDKATAYEVIFALEIQYPGQEAIVQEGTLIQQGEQFRLDLADYLIIKNNDARWLYMKPENTVNLYDAEADDGWKSPTDILRIYESDAFVYTLLPEQMTNDPSEQWIEFKSLESATEYSKVRMQVGKKDGEIHTIRAFGKDGSQYNLSIKEIRYIEARDPSTFIFNPKDYPGVRVEDLRID